MLTTAGLFDLIIGATTSIAALFRLEVMEGHPSRCHRRDEVDTTPVETESPATIIVGPEAPGLRPDRDPALLYHDNAARAGTVLSGTADIGSGCAVVHDPGDVADPVTLILTVTHP